MNETNNTIGKTMTNDFPTLTPLPSTDTTLASSSFSFVSYITSVSLQTWIIIILILAILGINIFAYLAKGTQSASNIFNQIFSPILKFFGYETLETTKQTITNTATGTTVGVNALATTANTGITSLEQTQTQTQSIQGQMASTSNQGVLIEEPISKDNSYPGELAEDSLDKALNNATQTIDESPEPLIASSSQTTGESGWCYIGEDRGVRTCSKIGVNDVCMSGDVFPTQDVCVNPSLRV